MSDQEKPTLAAFWGDTRKLLSYAERKDVLPSARLESMTPTEILLRDLKSNRLIVITSVGEADIFCDVCDKDKTHHTYGRTCPHFAQCVADAPLDPTSLRVRKNGSKG